MSQDLKLPFTLKAKQYQQNSDKSKASDMASKKSKNISQQPYPNYYTEIKLGLLTLGLFYFIIPKCLNHKPVFRIK